MKLLLAVLTFCFAVACTKSSKTSDPTEDLAWLKAKKTEMAKNCECTPSIWQATYEGRTIYETGCSGPHCFCAHVFYDQDGRLVPGSGDDDRLVFLPKVVNRELIWSCE